MIPKRIFFYWGNEKMSWMRYMTLFSFAKYNPDFKITLYYNTQLNTEKTWNNHNEQDFFKYKQKNYIDEIKKLNVEIKEWEIPQEILSSDFYKIITPSQLSNMFKFHMLAKEGGIYSDMDILYHRSLSDWLKQINDNNYDTGICQTCHLSIGFLFSAGNNDFYGDIFKNNIKSFHSKNYQSAGVLNIYNLYKVGPAKVLEEAIRKYPNLKFYNIPMNLVYPYNSTQITYAFSHDIDPETLPEETIGYHWYAGHPICQKHNNEINKNSYGNYKNLFCNLCNYILEN